jgi:hypothetical protein
MTPDPTPTPGPADDAAEFDSYHPPSMPPRGAENQQSIQIELQATFYLPRFHTILALAGFDYLTFHHVATIPRFLCTCYYTGCLGGAIFGSQVQISQIRHSGLGKACPTKFVSLALRADGTLLASFDLDAKK